MSWARGDETAVPAGCNRRGCFDWAGSDHHMHRGKAAHSTTPPCHHVTMPPPSQSVLAGVSPCAAAACSTQGSRELLRNSILISFVKRRCHGVMVAWNRRGCFGWAGSNHHVHQGKAAKSTTPPCHHVAMPPPSHSDLFPRRGEPACAAAPCHTQGTGELLLNSILISFVKRR